MRQNFNPREYQRTMIDFIIDTPRCAAKIIQAGVARVVAQMPAEGFGERWAADMRSASAMFLEAGVGFEYLEPQQ